MTSPMAICCTSISRGRAPESSMVLKKMGAIVPPITKPPVRLFGMQGMSSPMYQRMEFVADLREEPVPTTSPTYTSGKPFFLSSAICLAASVMPSRGNFSIAKACSGMSGLDQASGAGERSSVFVSPVTLNTVKVTIAGSCGRFENHSAFAHDSTTRFAKALPAFILSSTSWKASNISSVSHRPFAACSASSSARSKASMSGCTL
mmetsp:Transcript_4746/g.11944  ORF Transcript_4746/g.11944 Transcript_4746/m.11944 type:complete len:205 (-) Transcript_4746:23-637(-)